MPKMWRGPSADLKAATSHPIYDRVARRAAKQGIFFYDEDVESGCTILVRTVERAGGRCGTWFWHDLGRVSGHDPIFVMLWASHAYTDVDQELFALHQEYLVGQIEKLVDDDLHSIGRDLPRAVDEFLAIFDE